MKHLWTPWRYKYISAAQNKNECIFCLAREAKDNKDCYILYRGEHNIIILNVYPYTSGHMMIAPYKHIASPLESNKDQIMEMSELMLKSLGFLNEIYSPGGFNIGMNIGRCAGAGFYEHFHLHVLPRWEGDTNFMATLSETRLIPEDLDQTYEKLLIKFISLK